MLDVTQTSDVHSAIWAHCAANTAAADAAATLAGSAPGPYATADAEAADAYRAAAVTTDPATAPGVPGVTTANTAGVVAPATTKQSVEEAISAVVYCAASPE
ncbi:hypothetical protein V500_02752 [Pseudogymnoascus sp. VKM F-4518 (FW-2643)]|nr:hypothetical protein V500_02752 [Pseudogymnoascus sp. VKM F-4518 (FW-2643)]